MVGIILIHCFVYPIVFIRTGLDNTETNKSIINWTVPSACCRPTSVQLRQYTVRFARELAAHESNTTQQIILIVSSLLYATMHYTREAIDKKLRTETDCSGLILVKINRRIG